MSILAADLAVILAIISGFHVYWALGGLWPGRNEAELVQTVVGQYRAESMPPRWLTGIVALLLAIVAAWPLFLASAFAQLVGSWAVMGVTLFFAWIFLFRGLIGYSKMMRRRFSAQPFAAYNRRYYSPLCLLLGTGFLILAFDGGIL